MSGRAAIRIGTSGWIYPHWRGVFYPRALPTARWFEHYASHFDTVEINNTFYRLPEAATFEAWREQAPPGFLYAVKANRYLTHMRKLSAPAAALERFLGRARLLRSRLGPLLYQLPPHWRPDQPRLRAFLAVLPRGLRHAVEFRDPAWLEGDTLAALSAAGVALCIHDLIERHPRTLTAPFGYVRFHGAGTTHEGCYSRRELRSRARWLIETAASGRAVYAYFNNDLAGHAVRNALALRELVAAC